MARSAKPNMASQKVQMGGFYESLYFHRTLVFIVCQYIFIVICGPEVQYTTAVIHTACSLAPLKLLASRQIAVSLRPMIATKSSARKAIRSRLAGSPRNRIPSTTAPAAPMPTHTA